MKVIFLDRDGVINEYPGDRKYVIGHHGFKLLPGSLEAIKKFNKFDFKVFVVSNQAGVAKGLYTQEDLEGINRKMINALKKYGAHVSGIYYCTHLSEDNCNCRKPKPGLLNKAVADLGVEPQIAFFIGDSFMDMKAAVEFGAKTVLVLSGREKISNRINWEFEPDYVFDNLLVAANYICSNYG